MKAYLAFTKKEFCEMIRTYKLFIMGMVFLLFGMMSPVSAKYMPRIIQEFAPGMLFSAPHPSAMDSWAQFFKNVSQIGLFVVAIVFGGIMSSEFSKGTLINMLTKGLPRRTVILSKFSASGSVWTMSYILCLCMTWIYTYYFFHEHTDIKALVISLSAQWIFGLFLISVLLLGSVLLKSGYGCLLFTGAVVIILLLINIAPKAQKYNPVSLTTQNMALLKGQAMAGDLLPALLITIGAGTLSLIITCAIFNKKSL